MNAYWTQNNVSALDFCSEEGKTRRNGENSGRACSDRETRLAIAERALNEPRSLTSTTATPQKQY
jgi:hypothetical protein